MSANNNDSEFKFAGQLLKTFTFVNIVYDMYISVQHLSFVTLLLITLTRYNRKKLYKFKYKQKRNFGTLKINITYYFSSAKS